MNDYLWDRVRGVNSETLKGCEWVEPLLVLTRLRGTGIISLNSWGQCPWKYSNIFTQHRFDPNFIGFQSLQDFQPWKMMYLHLQGNVEDATGRVRKYDHCINLPGISLLIHAALDCLTLPSHGLVYQTTILHVVSRSYGNLLYIAMPKWSFQFSRKWDMDAE